MNIRAETPIKSNLLYNFWFTENSETVLKDVIYGKPKQIRQTIQFFLDWVNIKVNSQLIMMKTKMMSKSNMAETNMAEIPIWRESKMADIPRNKGNSNNFVFRHI